MSSPCRPRLAASLFLLLAACGDKSAGSASASASGEAAQEPAFTGPLTGEQLMKAKGRVRVFEDWDKGYARLERLLGKPTRVKDSKHQWAVIEGDSCTYMYAEKDDRSKYQKGETGDMVGTLMEPMKVSKGEALMNYDECLEIAGKSAGPPEDPNAVAPPADGSAVPLQVMLDNAVIGRSKWDGKKVKVSALLFSVSTSQWTSGDKTGESTSVSLVVARDKTDATLSCLLKEGAAKPDPTQYTPVTVEGTVKVAKWMSMGGTSSLKAELIDCTVTVAQPAAPAGSASAAPSASAGPPGSAPASRGTR